MQSYQSTLTRENALARARALRPLFAQHAEWADRERRVHPEIIQALHENDLFDLSLVKRAGGPCLPMISMIEVVAELGKECPGSAWAFNLLQGGRGMASAIPPVHAALFKTGRELFCGAFTPNGAMTKTKGGWRISGRWPWSSGSLHADYGGGSVPVRDESGAIIDTAMFFAPIGEGGLAIADTWHTAGMRASGSNTLVSDDLFVPDSGVVFNSAKPPVEALYAVPGIEPRDLWPLTVILPLGVLAPCMGAAEGMLERVKAIFNSRGITYWKYANLADSQASLKILGECQLRMESAWHHVRHACSIIDDVATQQPVTPLQRAQVQGECAYAMSLLRQIAQDLLDLAGSSALALSNPLQRLWRDLNTGSRHAFLNTTPSIELYGRELVGAPHNLKIYDGSFV